MVPSMQVDGNEYLAVPIGWVLETKGLQSHADHIPDALRDPWGLALVREVAAEEGVAPSQVQLVRGFANPGPSFASPGSLFANLGSTNC